MGGNKDSIKGKMACQEFESKSWEETDTDFRVTHCGVCGSNLHLLRIDWASTDLSLDTLTCVNEYRLK
jgi:alcohol dehydrogenase (NADP+)